MRGEFDDSRWSFSHKVGAGVSEGERVCGVAESVMSVDGSVQQANLGS